MSFKTKFNAITKYYKKNGFVKLIKKIKHKLFNQKEDRRYYEEENENYRLWIKENEPNDEEINLQREKKFEFEPKISIVVPMYNTKEIYLKELVESILQQTYANWELCLADGSPKKMEYVEKYISKSDRIKYKFLNNNYGISGNTNCALEMASGEYIALLDHDDVLPIFSLYEIVKTINENRNADFIYTDEDKILDGIRMEPHFKQDFAPDTFMSYNYICHFSIFKKSLIDKIGKFNSEYDGSQDYDFILRATENANEIIHIPKILYHWRMTMNSVALNSNAKPYAYEAAKKAIKAHLERIGESAEIYDAENVGTYQVKYNIKSNPKVSIIILNDGNKSGLKRCIKSIFKKTNYENFEIVIVQDDISKNRICKKDNRIKIVTYVKKQPNKSKRYNFGVQNSTGDYLIFLSSNMKIMSDEWIETMLGNCQRNDVGIVGAKIVNNNLKIKHVGIVLDKTYIARNVNEGMDINDCGYMVRNNIVQNYYAVTKDMLMISRNDYDSVNGFDNEFPDIFSDVDLCLKMKNKGKEIVVNTFVLSYYFKSKSEGKSEEENELIQIYGSKLKKKWSKIFEKRDPYFSPNFRNDITRMRVNPQKVK